jgi:hypothetical protein
MKRIALAAGAVAVVGVLALAGCSNSNGGLPSKAGDAPSAVSNGGGGSAAQRGAQAPAIDDGAKTGGQGPDQASAKAPLLGSQSLIRTADLRVDVARKSDVPAKANRAEQIATAAGGVVFADERTAGDAPTANLTLKVPGSSLVSVLGQLSDLGTEKARQTRTQDVTGEVADVDSRVRSAQASIDRLRVLFSRAVRIGDVISLETELAQREADLESLQAQQRSLAAQTSMATITLTLTAAETAAAPAKHHSGSGFLGGLDRGWRAFLSGAGGLATGVGAAIPFLALALLVVGAALVVRRRTRHGVPPVGPPAEGSAA